MNELPALIDILRAIKADPMACHSIAVWELIDAALAAELAKRQFT